MIIKNNFIFYKKNLFKKTKFNKLFCLFLFIILLFNITFINVYAQNKEITIQIKDTADILLNPNKGFVDYGSAIWEGNENFIGIGYHRYEWAELNPSEGVYNWQLIEKSLNEYKNKNKKFSFGVMNVNSSTENDYVTPKWVLDKLNETDVFTTDKGKQQKIPKWKDETFLKYLNEFILALSKKFDGNENIAFIDIRSYGNWGEGHLYGLYGNDWTYVDKNHLKADELMDLYIKPYKEAFKKTLLVIPTGNKGHDTVYPWAVNNGIALRRDGIIGINTGVSDGSDCLAAKNKVPVIYEYGGNYKNLNWSHENLLNAVETGRPTYMEFDSDMYKDEKNKDLYKYLANRMGYYFKIKEVTYSKEIPLNSNNTVKIKFKNDGVAPIYDNTILYLALLDNENNVINKIKTNVNAKKWLSDQEINENINININQVELGEYKLALGLFKNENDINPTYLFGSEGKTDDNWYVLGNINVIEELPNDSSDNNPTDNEDNPNTGLFLQILNFLFLAALCIIILIFQNNFHKFKKI